MRARFDSKTFVGLHFIAPYYYMVGVEFDDTHHLTICFHQQLHKNQFKFTKRFLFVSSLPFSRIQFEVCELPFGVKKPGAIVNGFRESYQYLGWQNDKEVSLVARISEIDFEEQVLALRDICRHIQWLEIDVYALWHLLYWQKKTFGKVILGIYENSCGFYLLWGRDDALWQIMHTDYLSSLDSWITNSQWPYPQEVWFLNTKVSIVLKRAPHFNLSIGLDSSYVLAAALACRGAYASI